jgi:hypothetical protein
MLNVRTTRRNQVGAERLLGKLCSYLQGLMTTLQSTKAARKKTYSTYPTRVTWRHMQLDGCVNHTPTMTKE